MGSRDIAMLDVSGQKACAMRSPVAELPAAQAPQHKPRPRQRDLSCTPPKYGGRASPNTRPSHPSVCGRRLRRYSL
ncbi:hypothetical protein LA080_012028 [Diaporthe eres]|nr:hypothetical protein LA080_012028 [Diaporthe eres]